MSGSGVSLSGWKNTSNQRLSKTFLFPDFQAALDFVNRVGALAEEQKHHPDIHLAWGQVDVETWTHDAGCVSSKDLILAEGIDRLFFSH
jgi:4a-hydroxytetrahydrobiopterin dehydratase